MHGRAVDPSTIIGIGFALFLIMIAISIDGSIVAFADTASILIVIIGTFCVTTACFSISEVIHSHHYIFKMILWRQEDPSQATINAIKMAILARKDGVEVLEKKAKKDKYSKRVIKGIMMIVDNVSAEQVERIMTQEIISTAEQQAKVISILRKSAEIAPAMGLIGTLVGLVHMLGDLSDVSKIGPAMAIALLTTFYGAILAYVVFFPLASKLERNSKEGILISKIYLKALISIAENENPRYLQDELNSLLSSRQHVQYFKQIQ